ncbi:AAA family ATPase [Cupriavidus necator]
MSLQFEVNQISANDAGYASTAMLLPDNWDDYSFKTLFTVCIYDESGKAHNLGSVKIGYFGQRHGRTRDSLPPTFPELPDHYFSLGQEPEYYQRLMLLPTTLREEYLKRVRDVVFDPIREDKAKDQDVFLTSLLRSVSRSAIDGQFRRILGGGAVLTEYRFYYTAQFGDSAGPMRLNFEVVPGSLPPTNIHVIIGRNGVGKTTLLNSIVGAIVERRPPHDVGSFEIAENAYGPRTVMPLGYFSSVTSVAFSAFDPFNPPPDQPDRTKGISYFYIGLKKRTGAAPPNDFVLKPLTELSNEFLGSLQVCLSMETKRHQWRKAISALEFDENFSEMNLSSLVDESLAPNAVVQHAEGVFRLMSSGHKIVLLTITKLVETVEEKSLVLLDEPESHLHPPLLSAFTRALSELLTTRNAVALIATHSPVLLQEVPRRCVWKIRRYRSATCAERPEIETFGENVGSLTREIFGLEVSKSGFHDMLAKAVESGGGFEQILANYGNQIGLEGQAILRSLYASRGH